MIFENFYHLLLGWIEIKLQSRHWILKLTLFSVALSIFLAFPPYTVLWNHLNHTGNLDAWTFIANQADNLLHPTDIGYGVYVRRDAMIYRWTLPFLSYVTRHNVILILLFQGLIGVTFINQIAKYVFSVSQDKITTCLFILSISNIFIGIWPYADIHGYGDTFAFFFILNALLTRNRAAVFFLMLAAFFTDERAVIAGGYVLLWWMLNKAYETGDFNLLALIKNAFAGRGWVIWVTWIVYFVIRIYIGKTYFPDHRYTYNWAPILLQDGNRYGLGSSLWSVFEGFWILIGAAFLALLLSKKYALLFVLSIGFIVLTSTGIYVHDIDRALSYGFPFLLMAVFILFKNASLRSIRVIFFFVCFICIVHPLVFTMGYNRIIWLEPLPMRVIMGLDRLFHWNLFN